MCVGGGGWVGGQKVSVLSNSCETKARTETKPFNFNYSLALTENMLVISYLCIFLRCFC